MVESTSATLLGSGAPSSSIKVSRFVSWIRSGGKKLYCCTGIPSTSINQYRPRSMPFRYMCPRPIPSRLSNSECPVEMFSLEKLLWNQTMGLFIYVCYLLFHGTEDDPCWVYTLRISPSSLAWCSHCPSVISVDWRVTEPVIPLKSKVPGPK